MLLLINIVDVLIYCYTELVQLLKVKKSAVMTNFVLNSAKMSDRVHSIANPLCVFDHLVSHHHILVIDNRFRKKLRCRVWFHFTKENSISFEDV